MNFEKIQDSSPTRPKFGLKTAIIYASLKLFSNSLHSADKLSALLCSAGSHLCKSRISEPHHYSRKLLTYRPIQKPTRSL